MLWGSYNELHEPKSMGNTWQYYYTEAQYKRLCALKIKFDPTGVFTPNAFCVGAKVRCNSCPSSLYVGLIQVGLHLASRATRRKLLLARTALATAAPRIPF